MTPLFVATQKFGPWDGERWRGYCEWAQIPGLVEIVNLDGHLCPGLLREIEDGDWAHIVNEDFQLRYFYHLDYLRERIADVSPRNILGLYRNPDEHIQIPLANGNFVFMGYDLIEEMTHISALTNCGGFPDVFANEEINQSGLVTQFERAREIQRHLAKAHPKEPHAQCELYAIWRLNEAEACAT